MLKQFDELTITEQQRAMAILDESCRSDIELSCRIGRATDGGAWINIAALPDEEIMRTIVQNAVWWCEKRGMFTCDKNNKTLIRFND